jgi:hypothetical protein
MERWFPALLVGLLGGAGGALAVHLLLPGRGGSESAAETDGTLATQLARVESAVQALAARGPTLEAAAAKASAADAASQAEHVATLRKAVREELATVLDQRLDKLKEAGGEGAARAGRGGPERKRATLAEAAPDLGLTRAEEDELRRIYGESQEKMMRLAAGEGGDVEAVRRDVEDAKRDPKKRQPLLFKYMPKMLPNLGEFMQVTMEQEAAVVAAVGQERAERIQREFDLVEANPIGVGGEMRVNARAEGR